MSSAPAGGVDGFTDVAMEWFDSHCHLQNEYLAHPEISGADQHRDQAGPLVTPLDAAISRASKAGVTRMVCVGTDAATSQEAVDLARKMIGSDSVASANGVQVWATVGLHPHDAINGVDTLDALLTAELGDPGPGPASGLKGGLETGNTSSIVVGIGECGLDYHYDHSPRQVQREVFAAQIDLAIRHRLALVIHSREAWDDTVDLLAATGVPERTIFHCFTGGPAEARRCLDLGAWLSFSGVVTFKTADEVREAASFCPIDRMLIETDAPFLTPVPHRGSSNEPARVPLVGAMIAVVKGISTELVAEASTRNARASFGV